MINLFPAFFISVSNTKKSAMPISWLAQLRGKTNHHLKLTQFPIRCALIE